MSADGLLCGTLVRTMPEETRSVMTVAERLESNRDRVLAIAKRHGVERIRVFGSVARGEDGPDSDVDFLVEAGPDTPPWFPGGLIADLQDLLGCDVHVVTSDALHWGIRDRVLQEATPL